MRRFRDATLASAIALLVVAVGATLLATRLGGRDGEGEASALTNWLAAAEREGSYRFAMKQTVSGTSAPSGIGSLFNLEGAYDVRNGLARTVTSTNVLGTTLKCTYLTKGSETIYLNVHPSRRAEIGATWLRSPGATAPAGVTFPLRPDQFDGDPGRSFADLEEAGPAEVRDVATTRYRGRLDLAALYPSAGASPLPVSSENQIPVEAFIDDEGLMRRLVMHISSSDEVSLGFTIDYFDYGEPLDLSEPPADEVKEASPEQIATGCYPADLGARE